MGLAALIGGAVVIGLALGVDANGTVNAIELAISVRGVTWLVKKITATISKDNSDIIDFTGWCIAGLSIIIILLNAKAGVHMATDFLGGIVENIKSVGTWLSNLADKIVFWR
jgi:hypothetical protein